MTRPAKSAPNITMSATELPEPDPPPLGPELLRIALPVPIKLLAEIAKSTARTGELPMGEREDKLQKQEQQSLAGDWRSPKNTR